MSCSNCYYYWNDEKYCPKRQMHMLAGDSCKYWKPNDAMSISQRMNEMTEQDKVTVDDIIGIVKTEEQTNSVEEVRKLRGRGNETAKRFTTDYKDFLKEDMTFIKNNDKRMTFQEVVDLLNEQHETIQRLKQNIDELLSVNVEKELLEENEQYKKNSISLKQLYKILEENKEHFLSLSECFSEKLLIRTIFRNIDDDIESREVEE